MFISITSILLALGGKCLLNWVLVFFQKQHASRSFLGVFSVFLAVVDAALTLTVTTIHICSDEVIIVLGYLLTSYHICLLIQIMGQVHRVLHWPVAVIAALDHFCTVTQRLDAATHRAKWLVYLSVTFFLWCLAAFYIFLLSDFIPILENVTYHHIDRCWVFPSSQILHIALLLLIILGCTALHAGRPVMLRHQLPSLNNPQKKLTVDQSQTHSRRRFVSQALCRFLHTWTFFLVFLAVLLLLPMGIPSYLDLNVAWLCFLNSLLIVLVFCAVCPASQLLQELVEVPPDSFCQWKT
ncbi:probable G-protein coupled receptor 160 [Melanotaenia boesemani]|uniref:probable G-protein coupled receptor 160 n=1 Tax=Melanotaenia boesemani TaxID=1250792 RepID=UPI001C05C7C6|nr:probable G-protein coupled receptor 160 [Melanotaenia boesemani]XP_041848375.1 probable G-protein coupled receptor 160 [Melanotaenia boesemani]XP_041848376.1 probable G-protein coupled receptor 160 [Melanotaenia boesemani]XP_041848377.1 probable G-protein coupled receptor 160 [Melanotaenia boesemani]